jgi:sulfite reductase (ferredoxin)
MTTETAPKTTGNGRAATAPRQKATNPRRKKGEGQWALGYREPLNPNEQSKKDDHPLNVRARIEDIYAKQGFASIDPNDLRGRFRWYGLYTQRRPGIDGGKTATLEPWELDDEYFMLRIRIDGGALTTEQLRVIGQISVEFARDTADVTDRQKVQLH